MSALQAFGVFCFLFLLCREVTAYEEGTPRPSQCDEGPQTGAWIVASFVRLPDNNDEEVLATTSVMRLAREADSRYTGRGAGVSLIPLFDAQPGLHFTYDVLGVYDNTTRILSASLVDCEQGLSDVSTWTFDCKTLSGPAVNAINGVLTPFPLRQEVTFVGDSSHQLYQV